MASSPEGSWVSMIKRRDISFKPRFPVELDHLGDERKKEPKDIGCFVAYNVIDKEMVDKWFQRSSTAGGTIRRKQPVV